MSFVFANLGRFGSLSIIHVYSTIYGTAKPRTLYGMATGRAKGESR